MFYLSAPNLNTTDAILYGWIDLELAPTNCRPQAAGLNYSNLHIHLSSWQALLPATDADLRSGSGELWMGGGRGRGQASEGRRWLEIDLLLQRQISLSLSSDDFY